VAVLSPVDFISLEELVSRTSESTNTPLFLILDHLSDVRNVGAIIRTAECTGVSGVILPLQGSAAISEDMVKTSAGAIFNIPLCRVENLIDAIYYLQGSGIKVIGATEKSSSLLYDLPLTEPLAIVMGAEDVGISKGVLKVLDARAKLPLLGETASLNVSVACGAFLYEVVRQRLNSSQ
jgi:RNA methyltransferase, trmH family, group 3